MRRQGILGGIFAVLTLAGLLALVRRRRRVATGLSSPGGVLMGDVANYDRLSRILFRSLFRGVAADVATAAPKGARVLEVGCGPGHLAIELAQEHGLDVTGIDLDPAMIERAQANADGARAVGAADGAAPTFVVGDAAALPFGDAEFDVVVSTFSLHHWADRDAGFAEIARVLRPGGRALIWDLGPGFVPFHGRRDEPAGHEQGPLRLAGIAPWRWPWRLTLAQRAEFVREPGVAPDAADRGHAGAVTAG